MTGARPFKPAGDGEAKEKKPWHANVCAERIMADHQILTDATETVWRCEAGCWVELPPAALTNLAWDYTGRFEHSRADLRAEVIKAIKSITYKPKHRWSLAAPHEVPCRNGMLDLNTFTLRPIEPEDYLERVIPWEYDPGAACPTWLGSLIQWFGDGAAGGDSIACLQEFFGYALLSHCRFKKALLLFGESNTGKSRVCAALAMLVGSDAVCHIGVTDMG
ncbi:MAG: hypothetical protein ACREEE_07295, partial [Dongiaceae bacterium]